MCACLPGDVQPVALRCVQETLAGFMPIATVYGKNMFVKTCKECHFFAIFYDKNFNGNLKRNI